MVRGILAVGDMMAATIDKTAHALAAALDNYASSAMHASAPLSQPLTISRSYVSRCVRAHSDGSTGWLGGGSHPHAFIGCVPAVYE
jgi:hypothetical protein